MINFNIELVFIFTLEILKIYYFFEKIHFCQMSLNIQRFFNRPIFLSTLNTDLFQIYKDDIWDRNKPNQIYHVLCSTREFYLQEQVKIEIIYDLRFQFWSILMVWLVMDQKSFFIAEIIIFMAVVQFYQRYCSIFAFYLFFHLHQQILLISFYN